MKFTFTFGTFLGALFIIYPALPIYATQGVIQYSDFVLTDFSPNYTVFSVLQESYHGHERFLSPLSRVAVILQSLLVVLFGKSYASILVLLSGIVVCFAVCSYIIYNDLHDCMVAWGLAAMLTFNPSSLEYLAIWPTAYWWFVPSSLFLLMQLGERKGSSRRFFISCLVVGFQPAPYFFTLAVIVFIILLSSTYKHYRAKTRLMALFLVGALSLDWSSTILISMLSGTTRAMLPTTDGLLTGMARRIDAAGFLLGRQYAMFELDSVSATPLVKFAWVFLALAAISVGWLQNVASERSRRHAALLIIGIASLFASIGPNGTATGGLWIWLYTHVPGGAMFRSYSRAFALTPTSFVILGIVGIRKLGRGIGSSYTVLKLLLSMYIVVFYFSYVNVFNSAVRYYPAGTGYERLESWIGDVNGNNSLLVLPNTSYETLSSIRSNAVNNIIPMMNSGFYASMMLKKPVLLQSAAYPFMEINDPDVRAVLDYSNTWEYSQELLYNVLDKLAVRYILIRRSSPSPETEARSFNAAAQHLESLLIESGKFKKLGEDDSVSMWDYCCWTARATSTGGTVNKWFRGLYKLGLFEASQESVRLDLRLKSNSNWLAWYFRRGTQDQQWLGESCSVLMWQTMFCSLNQSRESGSSMMTWIIPQPSLNVSGVYFIYWPDIALWASLCAWLILSSAGAHHLLVKLRSEPVV